MLWPAAQTVALKRSFTALNLLHSDAQLLAVPSATPPLAAGAQKICRPSLWSPALGKQDPKSCFPLFGAFYVSG